jgi:hypothetical protein
MNQNLDIEKNLIIRRKLLPWWIKAFCWFFMLMGTIIIPVLIYGFLGNPIQLSFYGFETDNAISFTGIFVSLIILLKGYAAYSLWFEKDNAISIGKFDAICGIAICFVALFYYPLVHHSLSLRLEILFLIPYYIKLNKMEYAWDNLKELE